MNEDLYTVKMDRPMGSAHPDYPAMIYPVNYGYVEGIMSDDGEEQDAYVLGVDVPVDEFTGRRIAIVHRRDDVEDKWIVVPENIVYTKQQIEEMIYFQEQYFDSYIEMLNDEMWDAYDCNENKLGYEVPRSKAKELEEGVYHIVVMVYTMDGNGKLLVTQRSRNKTNPLKWEVTGGSILAGETPVQGAVRELEEETGQIVSENNLVRIYKHVDESRHSIYHTFFNYVNDDIEVNLQEGETMNYQFLSYEKFKELVKSDRFVPSESERFKRYESEVDRIVKRFF